jgi:hypothetical protein
MPVKRKGETMTPEQLVTVILGILGVLLQLALKYAPKVSDWYQNHPNKGAVALGLSAGIGAIYFGLSCSPFAAQLKIILTCDQAGVFTLLNAIFIIATTQQLTYLFTRHRARG